MFPHPFKMVWLLALIFTVPTWAHADEKPDTKKICKAAQEQVKAIEQELSQIKEKKAQIEQEIGPVKTEFYAEQDKLRDMNRCSQGNPKNSPECEAQLAKVRELGGKVSELQNSLNPLTPRRVELENSIYKPKNDLILNHCTVK